MRILFTSLMSMIFFTILCGLIYPSIVTIISVIFFYDKSQGSLITKDGHIIGSKLIAQEFNKPEYFFGRPSSCHFKADQSSASNLGPTSEILANNIEKRRKYLRDLHDDNNVPEDLLTTSASGLDPHISEKAAKFQALRIAKARNIGEKEVLSLIANNMENNNLLLFGERIVNVLMLNLSLDKIYGKQ